MSSGFGLDRTIAAIATPYGEGGIGVIKISGEEAFNVLYRVFKLHCGNPDKEDFLLHMSGRRMRYGYIIDGQSGDMIDEVMAVCMKGPHTYSGENVAEIYCHGSIIALKKTLELILQSGAFPAEPGEFTKRAFLSGRLDLVQAEAVMDLIHSDSESGYEAALSQLKGSLSDELVRIRDEIEALLIFIAATLDYPDEDLEEQSYSEVEKQISQLGDSLDVIIDTADIGRIVRQGLRVAIIGKPNVGKSSLMNAFLHEERAIVTDIPGTTRDTIEEAFSIGGVKIVLTDTAGMRETSDCIEQLGIERSMNAFENSDIAIFVLDSGREISKEDHEIFSQLGKKPTIIFLNKSDLPRKIVPADLGKTIKDIPIIEGSIENNAGIDELKNAILNQIDEGRIRMCDAGVITSERQLDLLKKAGLSLSDALETVRIREPLDIIEIDVRRAYDFLGEILGKRTSEDIINGIFENFCLGK